MTETKFRSLLKAVSWRIVGTIDTFLISWIITGRPLIASSIAATEVLTKFFIYMIHERLWNRVKWGKS